MKPKITSLRENLMENNSSKHRGIHQTREQIFYKYILDMKSESFYIYINRETRKRNLIGMQIFDTDTAGNSKSLCSTFGIYLGFHGSPALALILIGSNRKLCEDQN